MMKEESSFFELLSKYLKHLLLKTEFQNEYQCNQCNGLGVIKTQCPMCKGAGCRKDMVTYDRHTGNTGGLAKCSHCAGTGQYTVMGCSKCDGKGFVKK